MGLKIETVRKESSEKTWQEKMVVDVESMTEEEHSEMERESEEFNDFDIAEESVEVKKVVKKTVKKNK